MLVDIFFNVPVTGSEYSKYEYLFLICRQSTLADSKVSDKRNNGRKDRSVVVITAIRDQLPVNHHLMVVYECYVNR